MLFLIALFIFDAQDNPAQPVRCAGSCEHGGNMVDAWGSCSPTDLDYCTEDVPWLLREWRSCL